MSRIRTLENLLPRASLAGSLLLVAGLGAAAYHFNSQLALAQAADSFMDVFTAAVLTWTVAVSRKPKDEDHPFGHTRAQPIGGLVTAVVAGVVAFEVLRSSTAALAEGSSPDLGWTLIAVFSVKAALKVVVYLLSKGGAKQSPALRALMVDARNDVLVALIAIAGFFAARYGMPTLDAWLALPIALWIGWSGIELARDNIRMLMGEAPPEERQRELAALASNVAGVINAHDLRAQFMGTHLHVHLHVVVDPDLSLRQAHDIGEAVRLRLEAEKDVQHCSVHIDIE